MAPGELHIVLNWFGEVTARAQTAHAGPSTTAPRLAGLWKSGQ
jgi:hypothetical protein